VAPPAQQHGIAGALGAPCSAARAVLGLIVLSALLRLALAAFLGLSVDESYAVAISRHFELSYFDHPPLHLWLVAAWAQLLGSERPLLLRLPDIGLFAGSTWLMYRLTSSAYGERAGLWAALALNLAPLFTLNTAGGIVPDGPLVFFSLIAVGCFARAAFGTAGAAGGIGWMLGAGAAAGLALLAKYTAIFPILSLAVFVVIYRPRWLAKPAMWSAALLTAALCTPVLVWNHAHHWASFAFQGGRALPATFSVARAAAALLGQLLYLLPWIALALLLALARAFRHGVRGDPTGLFAVLAAPPILVFLIVSLSSPVLPHWAAIGWLFAFPLLGEGLARLEESQPGSLRESAVATAAVLLGLVFLGTSQAATGWLDRYVPALATHDPTVDFLDWQELEARATALGLRERRLPVATVSWIDAGKASYALGGGIPVLCLSDDPRHFAFMSDVREFAGGEALIVADSARPDWLRRAAPYFSRIETREDVVVRRAGQAALTLHTAWGYGLSERPTRR